MKFKLHRSFAQRWYFSTFKTYLRNKMTWIKYVFSAKKSRVNNTTDWCFLSGIIIKI